MLPARSQQPDLSQLSGQASLIYLWLAPEIRLCSGPVPTVRHLHSSPQPSALGYFPQLFKSSPYLKESIKPWLSHSPRQRSLHFKVAGCDAERESARQRHREGENLREFFTLRRLIYSSGQTAAVQRYTCKNVYTTHTNTLPISLLGNLHKLTFNSWTLTLPIIHWPQNVQINNFR